MILVDLSSDAYVLNLNCCSGVYDDNAVEKRFVERYQDLESNKNYTPKLPPLSLMDLRKTGIGRRFYMANWKHVDSNSARLANGFYSGVLKNYEQIFLVNNCGDIVFDYSRLEQTSIQTHYK